MPQQRVIELDAMTDQPFAVVDQQPQVEFRSVQVRGREGLKALLHRGAGDDERVDRIRLAALTGALACIRGQVRRDPQHPLAALDQESLQRSGDVPAVLERPHAVAVEAARPPQQRAEPAPADLDGLLAEQLAGRGRHGGHRVRTLVRVRAKHDHDARPPLDPPRADVWWTRLARGGATHLSSHARPPRPATSDKTKEVRPSPADSLKERQLAARSGPAPRRRTTPTAESKQQASMRQRGRVWFGARRHAAARPSIAEARAVWAPPRESPGSATTASGPLRTGQQRAVSR